jgi:aminoglycoside phosphotransferase (APT) family kinase protein
LATADAALHDADVADRLLAHLRQSFSMPTLAYAEPPQRLTGGFETCIFRFRLAEPPAELAGPLVLRRLRPYRDPTQIRFEAALQNALTDLGYAAPRALLVGADPAILDGAFMVMQLVEGRPLAQGMDGLISGAGFGRVLRLVVDVPRVVERMARMWAQAQASLNALPAAPVLRALEEAGLSSDAFTYEGRLKGIGRVIDEMGLAGLKPAVAWLQANRRSAPAAASVCHGDLHPLNILAAEDKITGVLDWGNTLIGEAALDVGSTIASLATAPIDVPRALRPLVRGLLRYVVWRYRRAYIRLRPVDPAAVRYYEVFRSLSHLVGALRSVGKGAAPPARTICRARSSCSCIASAR